MPANATKLFVILKKRADADAASFEAACAGAIELALADGHYNGFVHGTTMPPPGGGDAFADHVLEFWFETADQARDFAAGPLAAMMKATQGHLDEARELSSSRGRIHGRPSAGGRQASRLRIVVTGAGGFIGESPRTARF